MSDPIEIHLFGRLHVRRSDGSIVRPQDWSTGKTTDLVRLLALDAGQSVRSDTLIGTLWPDAAPESGRASLRTATSKIRKAFGASCIDNHLGMLTLRGVWVDTVDFTSLATEGLAAVRSGDHPRVVALARRAEALYVGDFRAHADDTLWAARVRDELASMRRQLVTDAAESAMALFWLRDAIELARVVIAADPASERAYRVLMRAHAVLGQTESSLRAFEACRAGLAEELGADPSAQTRALHLAVLNGTVAGLPHVPFAARDEPVRLLGAVLDELRDEPGLSIVVVAGRAGSGRHSLVGAAVSDAVSAVANLDVWGPLDGDSADNMAVVKERLTDPATVPPRIVVVLTTEATADLVVRGAHELDGSVRVVACPPLRRDELETLAALVLNDRPTTTLLDRLERESRLLGGRAMEVLREWLTGGRVMSSDSGVDLWDSTGEPESAPPVGARFRVLLEQLDADELRLCELLSVAQGPVTVADVAAVMSVDRRTEHVQRDVRSTLDRLVDRGVIAEDLSAHTCSFRERRMQGAFSSWMRPAARVTMTRAWNGTDDAPGSPETDRRLARRSGFERRTGQRGRRASDRPGDPPSPPR